MLEFLLSGLFLGLASSIHCAGMCGPLVLSMPFYGSEGRLSWRSVFEYHIGKTLMYAFLGALFGVFGMGIRISGFQQIFSIVFGVFLLIVLFGPKLHPQIGQLIQRVEMGYHVLVSKVVKFGSGGAFLVLGLTNGIIPCGMVYVALGASVLAYSVSYGALFMILFGLGTLPVLTSIIAGRSLIKKKFSTSFVQIKNLTLLILALLFILRGMNLGIPYLSPQIGADDKLECCKKH
jgi:sulfite exporter TauE/SafE